MRFFCSASLNSKTIKALLLLSWCCFCALPAINAQGQINGYWVSLCTTNGTELVLIENSAENTLSHDQHASMECPCAQHVIHVPLLPLATHIALDYYTYSITLPHDKEDHFFPSLLPRAPPYTNAIHYI